MRTVRRKRLELSVLRKVAPSETKWQAPRGHPVTSDLSNGKEVNIFVILLGSRILYGPEPNNGSPNRKMSLDLTS